MKNKFSNMHFAHCNGKQSIIYFIVIIIYNQQHEILIVYKLILVTHWTQKLVIHNRIYGLSHECYREIALICV